MRKDKEAMAPRYRDDEDFEYEYDDYDYDDYEYDEPRKRSSSGRSSSSSGKRKSSGNAAASRNGEPSRKKTSSGGKKSPAKGSSGKKMSAKAKAKKKRKRILLFVGEILLLAVMLLVLWGVTRTEKVGYLEIPEEEIVINESVSEEQIEIMKGYRNVALFGVDSTVGALTKNTRSDTIMVASINQDTKEIKLVSLYRDTFLNLGNDKYNKCNAAYANGGPKQAISMLNANLDLNISEFVTIGFAGLIDVIDALGGVPMDITSAEITHLNSYQYCIAENLKRDYTPVTNTGMQVLDGMQATGYCRIRYTKGDDFRRTERQRDVLKAIMEKSKNVSASQLVEIANNVFEEVYTSFGLTEITELLGEASQYRVVADDGFPREDMRWTGNIGSPGDSIVPNDLVSNVSWLHEFLFDESGYVPSSEVQGYSDHIIEVTSKYKP